MSNGFVSIIGAGPRGPELLTLYGARRLGEAHVVLYDALLGSNFFELFPPSAQRIYVGKRCGRHSFTQDEIHRILIREAEKGKRVVRLKGGDPFVFGRGGEEALALRDAGIDFEVVPGVSSFNGVGACVGIPVTHRGLARSVTLVEGHDLEGTPPDWEALVRFDGTLVFFMATQNVRLIASKLIQHGAPLDLALALVETTPEQQHIVQRSDLRRVAQSGLAKASTGPGLIYVGRTVGLLADDEALLAAERRA